MYTLPTSNYNFKMTLYFALFNVRKVAKKKKQYKYVVTLIKKRFG